MLKCMARCVCGLCKFSVYKNVKCTYVVRQTIQQYIVYTQRDDVLNKAEAVQRSEFTILMI